MVMVRFFVLLMLVFSWPGISLAANTQTFDQMSGPELDRISEVTLAYYLCVSDKLDTVTGADRSSTERIFATYPPFIRILRQQCRIQLLNVEKELYALGLNPEFVTNYVTTLRDDVQHFALQQMLKKADSEKTAARENSEGARQNGNDAPKTKEAPMGFGIFNPRKQEENKP